MTDNKTTPEQLVEKWLPDYQERFNKLCDQIQAREGLEMRRTYIGKWRLEVFPEALEAFARHVWDQACEEQRVICQDIFDSHYKAEQVENLYYHRRISCADAPEFKLTEKE